MPSKREESRTKPELLAALFHRRWTAPVLAELRGAGGGAKFVTLVRRLGIGRDILRKTLDASIAEAWVARNPGYGHPMRPEYLLTTDGHKLASWSARLMDLLRKLEAEEVGLRKWSMTVLLTIGSGRSRFSEIRNSIPGITARAQSAALQQLQEAGLVERIVFDDSPPSVEYGPTARGRTLSPLLQNLPRL